MLKENIIELLKNDLKFNHITKESYYANLGDIADKLLAEQPTESEIELNAIRDRMMNFDKLKGFIAGANFVKNFKREE